MAFDFGTFFSALGAGLQDLATYSSHSKDEAEKRKQIDQELALRQASQAEETRYHNAALAADQRKELQDVASHRADELYRAGIVAPESYEQNARAGALPEIKDTMGSMGGMAMNALRTAGQAGMSQFEKGAGQAQNDLYKSGGISADIPGGGRVFMDPGTRANLDVAHQNAEVAAENRRNAVRVALIRAQATGRRGNSDQARVSFMQKGISERMKPYMDADQTPQPGMSQAEAYRQTQAEWDAIHGKGAAGLDTIPRGTVQDSVPQDEFTEVRKAITGMDDRTARQSLEVSGYTPDEITKIMGK